MLIKLGYKQFEALTSEAKVTIFIAGLGAGKSLVGGHWALERAKVANSLGLAVATDYQQMKLATLPRLQEAWAQAGYIEDEHYVINKQPPRHWGVRSFTTLAQTNILTWCWGSYLVLGGTENYGSYRGLEIDYFLGDEVRQWRAIRDTINVILGRLRGQAYQQAGLQSPMLLITSPLDDPEELESYFSGQSVNVIRATTMDNLANLPGDYVQTQEALLDPLTFKREILGIDTPMGGMRACWAFSHERYPAGNVVHQDFDPTADTYMTWDFNSSATRPMSTILYQRIRSGPFAGLYVVTASFINLRTQTHSQCEIVHDWLVEQRFRGTLYARGDKTGEVGNRGSSATQSDVRWIEKTFTPSPGDRERLWKAATPLWQARTTRRVKNRLEALNAQFQTKDGRRHMLVDDRQTTLLTAIRKLKLSDNGNDLEETLHNDPVSALSYGPYTDHPVHMLTESTRNT